MTDQSQQVEVIRAEVAPVVAQANAIAIRDAQDYGDAAGFLKEIKSTQKRVEDWFADPVRRAHEAWKALTTRKAETLAPLTDAERRVKRVMLDWQSEQERIRMAEQRRLQAEADAKAEAERKRLEAQAAKMKTEAKREEYLERAAEVAAPVVNVAPVVPQVAGQSFRVTWKARLVSIEALTGLAAGDVRLTLVAFDQSAANRLAAATKGAVSVPGVEFYSEKSLASRGA